MPDQEYKDNLSASEWVPRPDPSRSTTQQLLREIANLRELLESRIDAIIKEQTTRLDAIDKATTLFEENLNRIPTSVDRAVSHLGEVTDEKFNSFAAQRESLIRTFETRIAGMDKAIILLQAIHDKMPAMMDEKVNTLQEIQDEKFSSVQVQFRERDIRSDKMTEASSTAVSAALSAAKEAVGAQNISSALAISKSETSTIKAIDQLYVLIQTGTKASDDKFQDVKERLLRVESRDEGKTAQVATQHSSSTFNVSIIAVIISFIGMAIALFLASRR